MIAAIRRNRNFDDVWPSLESAISNLMEQRDLKSLSAMNIHNGIFDLCTPSVSSQASLIAMNRLQAVT